MNFKVLTLFPEMFSSVLGESILKRAIDNEIVRIEFVNFREFAVDKHRTVDDYPFGGGAGMVLKPDPIFRAMDQVIQDTGKNSEIVLLSPQGEPFSQEMAKEFAEKSNLVLICGHYEGFDERIRKTLPSREVSLGDFVLTGGEIPAMAIIDAVVRLLPGVLGNDISAEDDSFSGGLLEYPQYTRPAEYRRMNVPEILLSGDHARIARWRHEQALYRTWRRRPELLKQLAVDPADEQLISRWEQGDFSGFME